jgi:hypothetical protein
MALVAIFLFLLHRALVMAHLAPLDHYPVIRRDRRELHGEHLPEQTPQVAQPQAPVEQPPPVPPGLAGLVDGGNLMNRLASFFQGRRTILPRIMDDWVPLPPGERPDPAPHTEPPDKSEKQK